jgi:hypothetical protein
MDYQKLKKALESKKYIFFTEGDYNLNFIWVRNDYHATNHFTDDLYVAYKEDGVEKILAVKCTTKPGLRGSLLNPTTVEGVTGTAVTKEGQYRETWQFIDSTTDFSKYPFFRQIKNINYWRDGDKDTEIDLINEQKNKLFGTHWHRMSNFGDQRLVKQFEVNNWSLGCMGAPMVEWDKVIEITRKAIKNGQSTKFTGTIININDLA